MKRDRETKQRKKACQDTELIKDCDTPWPERDNQSTAIRQASEGQEKRREGKRVNGAVPWAANAIN